MAERPQFISEEELAVDILQVGAIDIRDIDAGEEPFLYSSGNHGPIYYNVKGIVGRQDVFKRLCEQTALRLADQEAKFDFVAGNATGGMVPAYQIREDYQRITDKKVPYIYVRNTRKIGGHQEHTTGLVNNPEIPPGSLPLVVEELVNFAQTTCNSAEVLKREGYPAANYTGPRFGATIFHFENPEALAQLAANGLTEVWTVRLATTIEVADRVFPRHLVEDVRRFIADPLKWQADRGYSKKDF